MPQEMSKKAGKTANERGKTTEISAWIMQPRRIQVEIVKLSRRSYCKRLLVILP